MWYIYMEERIRKRAGDRIIGKYNKMWNFFRIILDSKVGGREILRILRMIDMKKFIFVYILFILYKDQIWGGYILKEVRRKKIYIRCRGNLVIS